MFLFASDLSERRDDVSSYFVFSLLWWRLLHKTAHFYALLHGGKVNGEAHSADSHLGAHSSQTCPR
jgi:hypothetical protein